MAAPLGHSQCNCELGAAAGFTLKSRFWWGVLLTTEPQCWHKSTAEFPKRRSLASRVVALLCCYVLLSLSPIFSNTKQQLSPSRRYLFLHFPWTRSYVKDLIKKVPNSRTKVKEWVVRNIFHQECEISRFCVVILIRVDRLWNWQFQRKSCCSTSFHGIEAELFAEGKSWETLGHQDQDHCALL